MERARLYRLLPKFSPTDKKDMASSLAEQIALLLNQKPNQVERSIEQIVHDIRAQLAEFGEVHINGLGVFRSTNGDMSFDPDPTIVDLVNPEYAVLEPLRVEVAEASFPAQPVLLTLDPGQEAQPEADEAFAEPDAAVGIDAEDPVDQATDDHATADQALNESMPGDPNPVVLRPDAPVSNGVESDIQPPDEPEEAAGISEAASKGSADPVDVPPPEPVTGEVEAEPLDARADAIEADSVLETESEGLSSPDREGPGVDKQMDDEATIDEESAGAPVEGGEGKASRSRGAAVLIVDPDVAEPGERLNNATAFRFATEPEARKQRIRSRKEERLQVRNWYIWVLGTVGVFLLVYTLYLITGRFSGPDAPPIAAEATLPATPQEPADEAAPASLPGGKASEPAVSVGPVGGADAAETPPSSNDPALQSSEDQASEEATPAEQVASAGEQAPVAPPAAPGSGLTRAEGPFALIVVSTPSRSEAQTVLRRYEAAGLRGALLEARVRGQTYYRVAIGGYPSLEAARADLNALPSFAPSDAWATQVR